MLSCELLFRNSATAIGLYVCWIRLLPYRWFVATSRRQALVLQHDGKSHSLIEDEVLLFRVGFTTP